MGWLKRILGLEEKRVVTLADFLRGSGLESLVYPPSVAGVTVTARTALNFSAYFNGVHIISSQVGLIPRFVYRRLADGGRERADAHPAFRLLHDQPNPRMTPFVFWQTLTGHVLTWGNAYAEIEWDRALRPIALWPLTPDRISPVVEDRQLRYRQLNGGEDVLPEDILHLPGLGFDGIKGYSVVEMARRSLALGLAAETFGASFFGNNAVPGIVLEHPKTLTDGAHKRLKASWLEEHEGPYRAHKPAILEEGMQAKPLTIPPDDAQFLQTREFSIVEVARWLNLPPHKLKHKVGERPGGNLEASQIEFLTDTLLPWLVLIEQECARKLISSREQRALYVEHLPEAILRVDYAARLEGYAKARQWGWMSANDVRERENMAKLGKAGDRYLEPVNMVAVGSSRPNPARTPEDQPEPGAAGRRLSEEHRLAAERRLAIEQLARYARREAQAARKAAKKGPSHFNGWIDSFYEDELPMLRSAFLEPLLMLRLPEGEAKALAERLSVQYVAASKDALLGLRAGKLEDDAQRLLERWELMRPVEFVDAIYAAIESPTEAA